MKLSLVIPVNNEEENLPLLFEDIYQALVLQRKVATGQAE